MLLITSHVTMKTLLLVATSNFESLGKTPSIFSMCEQFPFIVYNLYQIISSLWGRPYSGREGKHAVVLVT